jgi:1-aminocyclopropane-1-carboxylate deaminase
MGFPVLKGAFFLNNYVDSQVSQSNWSLIEDYHFGGYAKVDSALVDFVNNFKRKHRIALDPIYTGKMMFGLWDLIEKEYFSEDSKIIAIHTGGIQGIKGMNDRLKNKNLRFL